MLQFLTSDSNRYTLAQQVKMALDGGCTWIHITKSLPQGATMRQAIDEVRPMCEEHEAFLMIDSDVALVEESRIHGVHLSKDDPTPAEVREKLGAHAVIGVDVATADDIIALRNFDIDYVVLEWNNQQSIDDYRAIIAKLEAEDVYLPIVVRGDISITNIAALLDAGVSGVAVSNTITNSPDPVTATKAILDLKEF